MSTLAQVILIGLVAAIAAMVAYALLGGMTARLRAAAAHYGDVNAVVELTRQLENHPGLMEKLAVYPDQVVAAAFAHRLNAIGRDLEVAQAELSVHRRKVAEIGSSWESDVRRAEKLVAHLQAELQEVHAAAAAFNSARAAA